MKRLCVDVMTKNGKLNILFSSDCGIHNTNEIIDEFDLDVDELLTLLRKYEDEK